MKSVVLALVAMRLVRGWNQTGMKYAGGPDIVTLFLNKNPVLLWALISLTYLWIHRELIRGFNGLPLSVNVAGTTGLLLSAFSFKLAFTNEDSPELVAGFAKFFVDITKGASLMARARAVFIGLGIATATVVYFAVSGRRISSKSSGKNDFAF